MIDDMKKIVRSNSVCVLASCSDNVPHCSMMSYITDDDCKFLHMASNKSTKKYHNLIENPYISVLIDTREKDAIGGKSKVKAITINGIFKEIINKNEKEAIYSRFLEIHPDMKDFVDNPNVDFFSVEIESMQLLDGIEKQYFKFIG